MNEPDSQQEYMSDLVVDEIAKILEIFKSRYEFADAQAIALTVLFLSRTVDLLSISSPTFLEELAEIVRKEFSEF